MTMRLHVSSGSAEPPYRQLVRQIRQALQSRALRPGERLPATRVLAQTLKLNANTIARAYRELERDGLVEAKAGAGTSVVGAPPVPAGAGSREARWKVRNRLRPLAEKLVAEGRRLGLSGTEIRKLVLSALAERQ